MSNIYEQLRERLDSLSTGFPATKNQIEMNLLRELFTADDAELFLQLSPMLEAPADIAKRLNCDEHDLTAHLEEMAKRGLLFRLRRPGSLKYGALPYVIGIMEFQMKNMDKSRAQLMEDYFQAGFGRSITAVKTPLMRTVPINREVAAEWPIASYDDVTKAIDEQKTIAVADCICRKAGRLLDRGCDMPVEACFNFGSQGDFYVENGMGRYVNADEAKAIVRKNLEEAPLVIQMANTQKGGGFCMCCGDCCGILRSLKMQPKPAEAAKSNYRAALDDAGCSGCESCIDRCQMDALSASDGTVKIDYDRCIGCGNCAIACPTGAMKLEKKPADRHYASSDNFIATYIEIGKERGKI